MFNHQERYTLFTYPHHPADSQSKRGAPIGRTQRRCRRLHHQAFQYGSPQTAYQQDYRDERQTAGNIQSGN